MAAKDKTKKNDKMEVAAAIAEEAAKLGLHAVDAAEYDEFQAMKADMKDDANAVQMDKLYAEISTLVKEYNDSAEFAEFKRMKKLDEEMKTKVSEYTAYAEAKCFAELKQADNIMVAAAKKMVFDTIAVKDDPNDDGSTTRVIATASKPIDPLRLHRKVDGGIGHDKNWWNKVERLNMLFTCEAAKKLGIDPKTVRDNIAMSESSLKVALANEKGATDKAMKDDIQEVVTAMLGEGYTVPDEALNYLRMAHTKAGREAMSVVCSQHKGMRNYMLSICHAAITGDSFVLQYKKKKGAA